MDLPTPNQFRQRVRELKDKQEVLNRGLKEIEDELPETDSAQLSEVFRRIKAAIFADKNKIIWGQKRVDGCWPYNIPSGDEELHISTIHELLRLDYDVQKKSAAYDVNFCGCTTIYGCGHNELPQKLVEYEYHIIQF